MSMMAEWRRAYEYNEGTLLEPAQKVVEGKTLSVITYNKPNLPAAKVFRNKILNQLLVLDDHYFVSWSQRLHGTRAIGSGLSDLAQGVLSAFVTASGASSAKSLGLVITGISTGRLATEKNIFLEKSADALISTMEENRSKVRVQMYQYMKDKPVDEYPLEEGLRDVLRYYNAGTLASAASSLQATAETRERQASAATESLKGDKVVAPQELERADVTEFRTPGVIPPKSARRPVPAGATPDTALTLTPDAQNVLKGINKELMSKNITAGDLSNIASIMPAPKPPKAAAITSSATPEAVTDARDELAASIEAFVTSLPTVTDAPTKAANEVYLRQIRDAVRIAAAN